MNQKKPKKSGQRESEARTGFKKAAGTPLPEENVDASDDEDEVAGNIKARESQADEDSEAGDEDSDDDDMPEGMTKESWKVWKVRIKDIEDREKTLGDLETLAEGRAVGKAEASGTVQSSKRLSDKTPKKIVKTGDEDKISPIMKKFIDEEVEKRLKEIVPKKEALVTRLFHDDDEDEARKQLEESMEMMRKADEKVKKIQAEKEAAQRRLIQEKIKEKLEQQAFEESQRRKRILMEEKHKEMIKKKKAQEIQILREEYEQRLKVLQQEVQEEKRKKERLEEIWKESQYDEVYEERDGWNQWFEDPEEQDDGETREESKDSSFLLLSSPKDPKEKDEAEGTEEDDEEDETDGT